MRIKRIGCQYFLGFGPWTEIHFSEDQYLMSIVAEWYGEPKRSNQGGKSSFVEIIRYGLFGKTRAKKETDLINKNFEEDMVTELEFDNGVTIQRGRSLSGDIILNMTGYEGADKKVVQEEINKMVGMSYEDFIMTSFFLQGDMHTFMDAGSTGQRQIIAKWLEKDYWKSYEVKAKTKLTEIQDQMRIQDYIISQKPTDEADVEIKANIIRLRNDKTVLEAELVALKLTLEGILGQLTKAKEKVEVNENIRKIKKDILTLNTEIADLEKEHKQLTLDLGEALKRREIINEQGVRIQYQNDMNDLRKKYMDKLISARELLNTQNATVIQLRKKYNELKDFNNICPVMQKPCTALKSISNEKTIMVNEGIHQKNLIPAFEEEVNRLVQIVEDQTELYNKARDSVREIDQLKKLSTPEDIEQKGIKMSERIKTKNTSIKIKSNELVLLEMRLLELEEIDVNLLTTQKLNTKITIADNEKQLSDIILNMATENAELKMNSERRIKAANATKEHTRLIESSNLYKVISYMFGKNGIPSHQVETAFEEIEEEAILILEKLQSDMTIEFLPDKETKQWEENCLVCGNPFPKNYRKIECPECDNEREKKRKDELSITIKKGDKEYDFNLESGGGQVLISLAIRLAFVRLLQRRIGVSLALIVFDEVLGMLDQPNRQAVFKLLVESLHFDFGFEQIFIISHDEEVKEVISDMIKITKFEKYSTFEWA